MASRLDPDMTTIADATVITPQGGSLSDYAFREGVYVFYRNGLYYFLWSVDDTGAKNYHVAYGTSTSPMGPITVAADPIVLIQDASENIFGTGHNSVLQIPGRDEWYIVYHRINKNYTGNQPGQHREVCIDRMEFNADGTIKRVTPTHRGIDPVSLDESGVNGVMSDSHGEIISTEWYDITGLRISHAPSRNGLYIRTDRYADGSVRSTKLIR